MFGTAIALLNRGRIRRRIMSSRRSFSYGLVGALLSLGAPLGLLALRRTAQRDWPLPLGHLSDEVVDDLGLYTYITVSTAIVFTAFGVLLGHRADHFAELSETDALTHLCNRRGLSRRLTEELNRFNRYGEPLALLLLDVDGLKDINDRFGHSAGDLALDHVAAAMRNELRASDVGARWGGDEFAILAANTPVTAARSLAERIRALIGRARLPWPLTVSTGIAALERHPGRQRVSETTLMQAADASLYDAKNKGRNEVVLKVAEY